MTSVMLLHEDKRSYGQGGGAETMLRDLTRALELNGHTVTWYQGDTDFETTMQTVKPDVCMVMTVHNFMGFGPVRWLQRHNFPHVWALMDYWPFCLGRMLLKDKDQSCSAVEGVCDGTCEQGRAPAAFLAVVNKSPVLALNDYTADIYRRNGLRVDYVAELGTDTAFFRPNAATRVPGKIVTLSAWAAYPTKGMHVLRAALKEIGASATLITGQPREVVRDTLQTGSIMVFPSCYEETWGLCLTEAMSSGLACIASSVSGPKAQITDGVTGRLFPNRDSHALAAILRDLLADDKECRRLGAIARGHVVAEHSLEAVGQRFGRVFEEVVNGA